MEKAILVEKAMYDLYLEKFGTPIDEMKMHKLMYFSQRESIIEQGTELFDEAFYGWKYGPVLYTVRREFRKSQPFATVEDSVSNVTRHILEEVLTRYGDMSSWNLSVMSHGEISWKLSRKGLASDDQGTKELLLDAIKLDAMREIASRDKA